MPDRRAYGCVRQKFSFQQSKGVAPESHNALSKEDVTKLYDSSLLDPATPHGFQARLMFSIALISTMRPYALVNLTLGQVQEIACSGGWPGNFAELLAAA